MPLPTPNLDDRKFQEIVDQAKRLIPRYTPEWTDHNVSDPGVALIELFAWMTDMLLYRVNQVPDKMYVKFLELIGVKLEPPRAAVAPITFYLSAAQDGVVSVLEGTEVASVRTETSEAIIFSTEETLVIRPPSVLGALTQSVRLGGEQAWLKHDLRSLELAGNQLTMFSLDPTPGDAFYIAFEEDHSMHVLALSLQVDVAGGAGVDPRDPPIEWQVWQGNIAKWVNCEVEFDATGGFNTPGDVILHLSKMERGAFQGLTAYWLRVRLTNPTPSSGTYKVSPLLEQMVIESRGGTVNARHAVTVRQEHLGQSEGTPGQAFQLSRTPILSRDPSKDFLIVEEPGEAPEFWSEVEDFADSKEGDPHYTLDAQDGTIMLGPTLLQSDNSVYLFGKIPSKNAGLRFSRYQHGGGVVGNVPKGALSVLRSSIPYVARVINRVAAVGGANAQSLEEAKLRAPQSLRTRTRAVTADDFEYLASQVAGVARSKCVTPSEQAGRSDPKPGQVVLVVLPTVENVEERMTIDDFTLSAELRSALKAHLDDKRVLGSSLEIRAPQLTWVSVNAKLRLTERASDPAIATEVRSNAEKALYKYLNPYIGGPQRDGWVFGRDLHISEVNALLQRVPGVEFVEEIQLLVREPGSNEVPRPVPARLSLTRDGVVVSDVHRITLL
jgi:predicted phage baseplate assembly protein